MRKLILLSSLVLALSAPIVPIARAALVYRAGEGWVSDTADSGAAEKTASAQFQKAQALETAGDKKKALNAYNVLLRKFPDTGVGPKAQLRIAELHEATREPERAFEAYGKYLTKYPRGEDFDKCVEAQFKIAKLFLNGERRKLFGVKTFGSRERAQQMFEEIVKNAPYSRYAPLAQFNAGQALEKLGKDTEAIAAYQQVVDKYPADQIAGDAQYQIGYLYLHESKNGSNDRGARDKARDAFEDFSMKYPQSEKIGQAKDNLTALAGTGVKKTLGIAQFYEKTRNFKAAAIYYQDVVTDAPGTPEATIAQKQLAHLKGTVGEKALGIVLAPAGRGAKADSQRRLQAQVETASRPDYAGPPAPPVPEDTAPGKPKMRTSGASDASPQPVSTGPEGAPAVAPASAPEPALPTR